MGGVTWDYGGDPTYGEPSGPVEAIPAKYFNITDSNSWPVAGLLVFLDSQGQPVRAELQLFDELPSHIHEGAVRQCRAVLQENFASTEPLPLRIMQMNQVRDALDVRLPAEGRRLAKPSRKLRFTFRPARYWPLGVLLVILAIGAGVWFFGGGDEEEGAAAALTGTDTAPAAAVQMAVSSPQAGAGAEAGSAALDLPPSRNANAQIAIGMRVSIVPGLRLTLRSEPGADAGSPVGYMMDGDSALVIGGPSLSQGTSDTIVWWLVQLDDGTEAWAAANTSNEMLLMPAQ